MGWCPPPFPDFIPLLNFPCCPNVLCLVVHHDTATKHKFGVRQAGPKSLSCCVTWGRVLTSLSLRIFILKGEMPTVFLGIQMR